MNGATLEVSLGVLIRTLVAQANLVRSLAA
nr:hypothetical protein HUO10_005340 [Paraburkholderia busanensis]